MGQIGASVGGWILKGEAHAGAVANFQEFMPSPCHWNGPKNQFIRDCYIRVVVELK